MKKMLTCTNYFIIMGKKIFKSANRARPEVTFWAVGNHPPPPPESQLAFHICYVKCENTLTCKRISWDSGGDVLKKIYFLYV